MKVVFNFEFLTYLYHNNSFFRFIYEYDTLTLPLLIIATFVCFFNGLYVWMLVSSILLLFCNLFFIFNPMQIFYTPLDWSLLLRIVSVFIGVWGLTRSFWEVKTMVLDNERVLDSWGFIVEGGGGREEWALSETEKFIIDAKMPGIITERKDVSPGFLGDKRKFLVVRHAKYREFNMFIGARSFGEHLDASWFLAVNPGFFKRYVSKRITGNPTVLSQQLDFFSQQDIKAMKAVAHNCFKRTLAIIQEELNLDPSGLNADTKGFLNVW